MENIKTTLQQHHQNYQQHTMLRFNLYYSEMNKSSNNSLLAKKDIETLAKRLVSRNYISGYIWVLAFDSELGIYAQVIFYLNHEQHDALVVMAVESYWEEVTSKEGQILELDVDENVISQFSDQLTCNLFNDDPYQFLGINELN